MTSTETNTRTHYVVTMWSHLALDHVVANVWATDRYDAFAQAHDAYPAESTVVSIRLGTADDLD